MTISLRQDLADYLDLRRGLGFKLRLVGPMLESLVTYMQAQGTVVLTQEVAVNWAKDHPGVNPALWANRLSAARGFARYLCAFNPRTEVPAYGILSHRYPRQAPHIYTNTQVNVLMKAARELPAPRNGLRPATIQTLIGLISVTGLRFSEATNLKQQDVDLAAGLLTVHRTKFGKTRFVPLHATTVRALKAYSALRDRMHPVAKSPYFFVLQRGGQVGERRLRKTFIELTRQTGLRGKTSNKGPRIHDFRHTLAVNTLVSWYHAGLDVERKMPLLSTFLGHTHVADTYWYLSASPHLLELIAGRLETDVEEEALT